MGKTLAYKILENHLVEGTLAPGEAITIKIDQTLTQDSTGTMVYLQLEAMEVDKVKTELSVAYIDHNTLQTGFENADDHEFIKSVARRHGVLFSKPGNGICHQLQLENYGKSGQDSAGLRQPHSNGRRSGHDRYRCRRSGRSSCNGQGHLQPDGARRLSR